MFLDSKLAVGFYEVFRETFPTLVMPYVWPFPGGELESETWTLNGKTRARDLLNETHGNWNKQMLGRKRQTRQRYK